MNCRVVLVRTEFAGNVGSAARLVRNFGASELVLVAPQADPRSRDARRMAAHGQDVLERARVVGELGEGVGDCVLVAGTSARAAGLFRRQSVGTPEEVMPRVVEAMASGPVALVFGPEPSGLTNAEVTRCHYLVHVPTDPACPALNLAQAVAICLYELRKAWLGREGKGVVREVAPFAEQERMFGELREALERIHFLYGEKADALMHGLRHLLGRAGPSPMEVGLLLGLARQIRWWVEQGTTETQRAQREEDTEDRG